MDISKWSYDFGPFCFKSIKIFHCLKYVLKFFARSLDKEPFQNVSQQDSSILPGPNSLSLNIMKSSDDKE